MDSATIKDAVRRGGFFAVAMFVLRRVLSALGWSTFADESWGASIVLAALFGLIVTLAVLATTAFRRRRGLD